MSKYSDWAEAFTIFAKYDDKQYGVSAEHDEVYAGPSPSSVSEDDIEKLDSLGWTASEDYDCFHKFT